MVSKAKLDLPDPDRPVNTMSLSRGRSTLMLRRLCSRALRTMILSAIGGEPISRVSARVPKFAAEFLDLGTEAGGVLETQLDGRPVHLFLECLDESRELLLRQRLQLALHLVALALAAANLAGQRRGGVRAQQRQDVAD